MEGGVTRHLGGEVKAVRDRGDDLDNAEGTEPAVTELFGGLLLESEFFSGQHDRVADIEAKVAAVLVSISSLESLGCGGLLLYEEVEVP